jgi:hypothetical protein
VWSPHLRWQYRPELDGLSTFAVVIVTFVHAGVAGAQNTLKWCKAYIPWLTSPRIWCDRSPA